MYEALYEALDKLDKDAIENALIDFLIEQGLSGEFLVWIEKWKTLRGIA